MNRSCVVSLVDVSKCSVCTVSRSVLSTGDKHHLLEPSDVPPFVITYNTLLQDGTDVLKDIRILNVHCFTQSDASVPLRSGMGRRGVD